MQPSAGPALPHTRTRTVHWITTAAALGAIVAAGALVQPADASSGGAEAPATPVAALAGARNVTADAIAIAAALANPWASVVLSGAVTPRQLQANLAALAVGDLPDLDLAEPADAYWASRAARPWH